MHDKKLNLYSEPYGVTGNIGSNFRRLLGAPTLDPLQTAVREAVQNIADASLPGRGPKILLRLRKLSSDQVDVLRTVVFADLPHQQSSRGVITEFLNRSEPVVLEICDFGTRGLGGPTRADQIPVDSHSTDFIDFLRNIGTPRNIGHGGGTYGFGKVALYRISQCSTIVVDTQVFGGGVGSRRVMVSHIGDSFDIPKNGQLHRFTGRHWWGTLGDDGDIVDPVIDKRATKLSGDLGFVTRKKIDSGTSIMILDLVRQCEDLEVVGKSIIEALLWNFWPRMMRDVQDENRFECNVEVDGVLLPFPQPEDYPPLDLYCKAMRAIRTRSGNELVEIKSSKPSRQLGMVAIEKGLRSTRVPLTDIENDFPSVSHHIALMRPVELVVKYLEGAALPDERLEWAGVFVANNDDEIERSFADAEPPAHDDWIPDSLQRGNSKTYVRVALRELRRIAFEVGNNNDSRYASSGESPPLARLANRIGTFLEGTTGYGAGSNRRGRRNAKGSKAGSKVSIVSNPIFDHLEQDINGVLAVFTTEVQRKLEGHNVIMNVVANIALDGVPAGRLTGLDEVPTVISICSRRDMRSIAGSSITLDREPCVYEIRVRMPGECAVTVDAEILDGESA